MLPSFQKLTEQLYNHICYLSQTIGERNMWHKAQLDQASDYIFQQFLSAGGEVKKQSFRYLNEEFANIEIIIPGTKQKLPTLILGAHYDTAKGTPGANDNATGVATLLEFAPVIKKLMLPYSVRLVAFANEEPPFIRTKHMGSYHYANYLRKTYVNVYGMLSLETIGFYSNLPYSQKYLSFLPSSLYPNVGNFIAFISDLQSKNLLHTIAEKFKQCADFPYQILSAPGWLPGINSSDQWAFWQYDYSAIMVTDTAPFRYQHYHKPTDTVDKLNFEAYVHMVEGLFKTVTTLEI